MENSKLSHNSSLSWNHLFPGQDLSIRSGVPASGGYAFLGSLIRKRKDAPWCLLYLSGAFTGWADLVCGTLHIINKIITAAGTNPLRATLTNAAYNLFPLTGRANLFLFCSHFFPPYNGMSPSVFLTGILESSRIFRPILSRIQPAASGIY